MHKAKPCRDTICRVWLCAFAAMALCLPINRPASASDFEIGFPRPDQHQRVEMSAQQIRRWQQGAYEVLHLVGNVTIRQGDVAFSAGEGVVWHDPGDPQLGGPANLILYLEQGVAVQIARDGPFHQASESQFDQVAAEQWYGRLYTTTSVNIVGVPEEISGDNAPAIFHRGMEKRNLEAAGVKQFQVNATQINSGATVISPVTGEVLQLGSPQPAVPQSAPGPPSQQAGSQPSGGSVITRIELRPRRGVDNIVKTVAGEFPNERVILYTYGLRASIESQELAAMPQFGQEATSRIVIEADNAVGWENPITASDGSSSTRYEFYLEGNVIFAMGDRVVYADRMYYDATFKRGTILNADMLTPIPSYQGLVRLKADVVQQVNDNQWEAYGAAVTSSRLGVPRYWLQSNQVTVTRDLENPQIDAETGELVARDNYTSRSRNNLVYVANIPVFYWPFLRTDLDNPSYYVERIRVGNDNVFGFQLLTGFDMFQLLGIRNAPENTNWVGTVDYLSKRGVGLGSEFDYDWDRFLGIEGQVQGIYRSYFIKDRGVDNLGRDRRQVPLEEENRGRVFLQHRRIFGPGVQLKGEIGWISDRNFLEEYFEREWDNYKDESTAVLLERNRGNRNLSLIGEVRVNDFFADTQWTPRLDHFILGQSFLFDRLVWSAHSTASYADFKPAAPPTNPVDMATFAPLAWETAPAQGAVAGTRHEIDLPLQMGAVKVVPYVLGDLSYWQEDLAGQDYLRAYGQTGVRASLPMWKVDPTVHSTLLNLNGLAHKMTFDAELSYADASKNFNVLPLYNALDDNSQEAFRRRMAFTTFQVAPGAFIPLAFDERYFAFRSGTQSYVATPAMEIADDLALVRTGWRNRWQTKRGLPGEARIIDWITFDIEASWFPQADRDNSGADVGLVNYDFSWHVGNRLTLVSDGFFDTFSNGLRTMSLGGYMSRPAVGNVYLGFRSIEGPISSSILTAALTYRMSDKWIMRGASSVDFGVDGNLGQMLSFIRVGESFLVRAGMNVDASRGNVGWTFGFEPRFLRSGKLGLVGGERLRPAGATYLE